jgi:hypothetical protein
MDGVILGFVLGLAIGASSVRVRLAWRNLCILLFRGSPNSLQHEQLKK